MTKLIEFNLEHALAGDKVIDQEGKEITQITLFKNLNINDYCNESECIVGVYEGNVRTFLKNGVNLGLNLKLYMAPKNKTYYVNLYTDDELIVTDKVCYQDRDYCYSKRNQDNDYVKTISFEVEC